MATKDNKVDYHPPAERARIFRKVVISLQDSPRLAGFLAQSQASGFDVFNAVDNREGQVAHQFDTAAFVRRFGRAPRPGEIGCTLSHMAVMREFARSAGSMNDLLLVAEDDTRFVSDFTETVDSLASHVSECALVVLADPYGPAGRRDKSIDSPSEHFVQLSLLSLRIRRPGGQGAVQMGRWASGLAGASAYLVTRRAAGQIIQVLDDEFEGRPWWVADFHGFYRDHVGVDVQVVRPNLAGWDGDSTIQGHEHVAWRSNRRDDRRRIEFGEFVSEIWRRFVMKLKSTKFDLDWRRR